MSILDALRGNLVANFEQVSTQLEEQRTNLAATNTVELLTERLADLELALEDQGWQSLSEGSAREFSRDGLDKIARLSRLMWLKNPLIRRGVNLRAVYTFGAQSPDITADDDRVTDLIEQTIAANGGELFDAPAAIDTDVDLHLDGGVFLALFTDPASGAVTVRSMPAHEIRDIVTDPDDYRAPRFYLRRWTVQGEMAPREAWYPHHAYRPRQRPDSIDRVPVRWDSPVMHWKAGGTKHMRFGVPEVYPALDWARAHKLFLEDWSTLVRSLSRFAWKLTAKRGVGQKAKQLGSTLGLGQHETQPGHAPGSTLGLPDGANLEAIPKTGATPNAADNRELRLMIAAAMDLPDTWLSGDVDVGNHATAQSMDRPTELMLTARRRRWAAYYRELFDFCMRQSVKAPAGILSGAVRVDGRGREVLDLGVRSAGIAVDWPPLVEHSIGDRVSAIVEAATLDGKGVAGTIPSEALARELMVTLGLEDVDDLVGELGQEPGVTEGLAAAVVKLSEAMEAA